MGETTELYKGEFCHTYKCSNLARKMRIILKATAHVGTGTENAVERTGIEKFTSTLRHL